MFPGVSVQYLKESWCVRGSIQLIFVLPSHNLSARRSVEPSPAAAFLVSNSHPPAFKSKSSLRSPKWWNSAMRSKRLRASNGRMQMLKQLKERAQHFIVRTRIFQSTAYTVDAVLSTRLQRSQFNIGRSLIKLLNRKRRTLRKSRKQGTQQQKVCKLIHLP